MSTLSTIEKGKPLHRGILVMAAVAVAMSWPPQTHAQNGPVRITILGDSIDADQPAERPVQGWGTYLESKLQNVRVANYASSGRSTKTYLRGAAGAGGKHIEPKFWIKAQATPADYWIVKFGGNDSHPATEEKHTDPDTEYAANLRVFIETARKLGVRPILVTPFRRPFRSNGQLSAELEPYAEAVRVVAKKENVPLIDLYKHATDWFTSLGPAGLQAYVPKDLGGHMNRAGALLIAQWMAEQLVKIVPVLRLAATPESGNVLNGRGL